MKASSYELIMKRANVLIMLRCFFSIMDGNYDLHAEAPAIVTPTELAGEKASLWSDDK